LTFTVSRKALLFLGGLLIFVIGGAVGAAIRGGGGDTTTTTVVETVAPEETASEEAEFEEEGEASASSDSEAGDCEEKGINAQVGNEGRCEEDGTTYVVADSGRPLQLEELSATLLDTETTKTASDEYGDTKTANGVYVIFTLEVNNKTHSPVYFDSGQEQTALYLGEDEYTEDFEVENWALDDSFLNKFEKLQPGAPVTGQVAFDVPKAALSELHKGGNLAIANFSDEGEGEWDPVGIIRTYK